MRVASSLFALVIASGLYGQAPAPAAQASQAAVVNVPTGDRYQAEVTAINQLVEGLKYEEAYARAMALVPTEVGSYDKETMNGAYLSYQRYWVAARCFYTAANAGWRVGKWEQAVEHAKKAQELAKQNAESTKTVFNLGIKALQDEKVGIAKTLADDAEYIKELRAKATPDPQDLQQLESVKGMEDKMVNDDKWIAIFQKCIAHAEGEATAFPSYAEEWGKQLAEQVKQLEEYKFKNDKVKFVEGIISSKAYLKTLSEMGKANELAFFYRLSVLDPNNKKVEKEIERISGSRPARVR